MTADLRAQLEAALDPVCWTESASTGELVTWVRRDTAIASIMSVVEAAIREAQRPFGSCRECWGPPRDAGGFLHHVSCGQYVGPVRHRRAVEDWRGGVGERRCSCGATWTVPRSTSYFDWDCPNAAETWRGPGETNARDE